MWLTVHRNAMSTRNQLDVTYVLSFISLLQVAQHVSGNHVPIYELLNGHTTCQPVLTAFLHGKYQHEAITSRSCQLLDDGHMVARNMLSNY